MSAPPAPGGAAEPPAPPVLTAPAAAPPPVTGDATGGIIPYKNPHALVAYYCGVFSVIPCLGFVLGCAAVPLGISGLRQRKRQPVIRGSIHAWIGIVLGSLSILAHLAFAALQVALALHRK